MRSITRSATAGLIIAEATQISPAGKGYAWTPGIYNAAQIAGWRLVTDAVHAAGGKIVLQLWHVGRFSHPSLQPGGHRPLGPSEIGPENAMTYIEDDTFAKVLVPRAMTHEDIDETLEDYRKAAKSALKAGFDGVRDPRGEQIFARSVLARRRELSHRQVRWLGRESDALPARRRRCGG